MMTMTFTTRWRRAGSAGVISVLFLGSSIQVWAQQAPQDLSSLDIEALMEVRVEKVFGAAKRLQPATEAPSSVSIITADDIARHGYRSLAEILRGVRGLYVTYDRNYSYLAARGFSVPGDYNTRVLLVVDGHRMNDDVYDQAAIGPELGLDPASFERVEIIRGPVSALYGTSAFFAVVNITTKRGALINGVSVGAEGGSLGSMRAFGSAGRTFANGVDVAVSASAEQSDGYKTLFYSEFDDPGTNDGIAAAADAEEMRGLTGRLSYRGWNISGAYGRRTKIVPTGAFDTRFNDPRFDTLDERAYVDVDYEREWRATRYSIRGYVDVYNYDGVYPYDSLEEDGSSILFTDYGHGRWWGAEGRVTRPLPGRQTLVGGLEFRDYATQGQGAEYEDDRLPAFTTAGSTTVFAAYAQDEIRIREGLLVSFGGRYDAYSGFDRFSPRASVVVAPTPRRSFKYIYGTAFRAPNAYELDYNTFGVRNTSLRAETITTNEVAWEEYRGTWLRTSVSAYRNNADQLLTLITDDEGLLNYTNAGRVRASGVEFEAESKTTQGVQALASYSWQRAEDRDTGLELSNAPRHLGKLRFSMQGLSARSTVAFELQAMSSRLTLSGGTAPAHSIVHLNYVQPIAQGVRFTASIRNLFDSEYGDPGSEEHRQDLIPQDGRTVRVGLQWSMTRR